MAKLSYYEPGDHNGVCDICGFGFKFSQLRKAWDNSWRCDADYEIRQPQDFVRGVKDNPAIPVARPRKLPSNFYLNLPTGATNFASIPNDITIPFGGQLDIRVKAAADNWTTAATDQILVSSATAVTTQFGLVLLSGTWISMQWQHTAVISNAAFSSVFPTLTNGVAYWIRSTLDKTTGGVNTVKFYTSTDYNPDLRTGTWTQVGTTQTGVQTTYISSVVAPIYIKKGVSSPLANFVGKIYYVEILSAIDGPIAYSFDPRETLSSTRVGSGNNYWTLEGGATMVAI